jgi:hypothetical protein
MSRLFIHWTYVSYISDLFQIWQDTRLRDKTSDNCRDVSALLTLFYSSLHSWWTWQSPEAKFSIPWTFFLLEKTIMSSLWQVSGSKVLDLLRFGIMEFLNAHLSLVVCWVMLQGSGDNGPSTGIQSNWWANWETGCKCVNFVTMKLWRFWESTLTLSFWTNAPRTWNPAQVVKFLKDDKYVNNLHSVAVSYVWSQNLLQSFASSFLCL